MPISAISLFEKPTFEEHTLVSPQNMISSGLCIGCGSCVAQADHLARERSAPLVTGPQMKFDRYGQYKPSVSSAWLRTPSASFSRTCPFSPLAQNEDELAADLFPTAQHHDPYIGCFQTAYVGYAAEETFREWGSSGGMVTWAATELLRKGLVDGVAHVVASVTPQKDERFFRYQISHTVEEIRAGAKSRYYPVELSDVIKTIRSVPGRYAVVGIPCFIKAIHLLCREDAVLCERVVFTLGLFCGHMKSARLVESFAWQMGISVEEIERVEYRLKNPDRPANWYTAHFTLRDGRTVWKDWWHLVDGDWGAGFFQNSACNFCDDVVAETADISFGDAWAEPYSADGKGTNVVIVRSPLLQSLITAAITEGRLKLELVDAEFVEQTQAAGFRQRREGLAYRLSWPRFGIQPRKRVAPNARSLAFRRKLIYRIRSQITAWSHRVFWFARLVRRPTLYIRWANAAVTLYHGLAYSRGKLGKLIDHLGVH
jgi:coenzyme F420-reducing hydrogenase beta subunit